ncbi:MAG: prolipoprotein diacylglyceryl transferase [Lachnospiraceae bacterium]|nr:prolipoprotein diacylglyceryl transferase [Lachnospiraceae bacterium]
MARDLFSIGRFTIHGYGLMIGLGFLLAVLMGNYRAKKRGLSDDHFTNMAICVLLFGFMGGKLLFIIVEYKNFFENPLGALGSEGFVVYGGIITGILTIILYCRIKKISVATYMDLFVPSVALNQGIGRIGCFLAGCCYGRETDGPVYVVFPEESLAPAGIHLLPTQLFSAAGMLLIAAGLILYARKAAYRGLTTGYYLLAYSIGRFIIEFFRNDYRGSVGFLSTSQFISIFIFALSIGVLVVAYRKKIPVEYQLLSDKGVAGEEQPKDGDPEDKGAEAQDG